MMVGSPHKARPPEGCLQPKQQVTPPPVGSGVRAKEGAGTGRPISGAVATERWGREKRQWDSWAQCRLCQCELQTPLRGAVDSSPAARHTARDTANGGQGQCQGWEGEAWVQGRVRVIGGRWEGVRQTIRDREAKTNGRPTPQSGRQTALWEVKGEGVKKTGRVKREEAEGVEEG